jgi:NAD(P)-dependent dehydrogenase (short-subunit alcohol dehydrogenase family)
MGLLDGKTALITGAGSGIGRAMALLFATEGAAIGTFDLDPNASRSTADEITSAGGGSLALDGDVSRSEDVQRALGAFFEHFGSMNILCNIAGIGSTQTVVDTDEDLWDRVQAVNVRGTYLTCKYSIPRMVANGGGTIINMSSVAGLVGLKNRAAYCAAKGAVLTLTKAIAIDHVSEGIRCNCLCPGTVDSPWVGRLLAGTDDPEAARAALVARQPMGRLGLPEEIAQSALYLASDHAAFVTGSALVIDGGLTAQ